jgi:hypothetical protein
MTPVKVLIVVDSLSTLKDVVECDVLPIRYKMVRLRELPAALILPFNRILRPFIPTSLKTY